MSAEIYEHREPWLRRWRIGGHLHIKGLAHRYQLIRTPWFRIWIHNWYGADFVSFPHDHPQAFISLVLRGGYTENVWSDPTDPDSMVTKKRGLLSVHAVPLTTAHTLIEVKPKTFTFLLVGRRHRKDFRIWVDGTPRSLADFMDASHKDGYSELVVDQETLSQIQDETSDIT